MPILPTPDYLPPLPFRSGNIATLYPPLFRPTPHMPEPVQERINTPDGDFLDMDHHASRTGKTRKLVIVSHGLEGHSRKKYVLGMARMATSRGYDAICWNQRGCGQDVNNLPRSYHSGETNDIHSIIAHCLNTGKYETVALIGFSMGGNQILKYLGEAPDRVPAQVAAAATFSVPCDLSATERVIARPSRRIYLEYFMTGLRETIRTKGKIFPEEVDATLLRQVRTLRDFDDCYTAPLNGFTDAADYYTQSSSKQYIENVRIPALLVNAKDDPFLPEECYPVAEAETNPNFMLEIPHHGGHVGFVQGGRGNVYWSEKRAGDFLAQQLG
ncbi:alpha/beta fold hydrolase [Pseudodesulfovibrio sp.]|nr:alpha/beta fold hydrolase [Pseudodesulfovibrio sp.]